MIDWLNRNQDGLLLEKTVDWWCLSQFILEETEDDQQNEPPQYEGQGQMLSNGQVIGSQLFVAHGTTS